MSNFNFDEMIPLVTREARSRRSTLLAIFVVVSLAFLAIGFFWPKTYRSSTTLYVDDSNIIESMLETTASTQRDKAKVAREILTSHEILDRVVADLGLTDSNSVVERERVKNELKEHIEVRDLNLTLLRVTVVDESPDNAYRIARLLASLFLEKTARSQSEESSDAFQFMQQQVATYRARLEDAEKRLEAFRSQYPGTRSGMEGNIDQRIFDLRQQLESAELAYAEAVQRRSTLERELSSESSTLRTDIQGSYYSAQIHDLQQRLQQLRLNFTDEHPDIVQIQQQIADYQTMMQQARSRGRGTGGSQIITLGSQVYSAGSSVNPVYQQLKADLARTRAEENSLRSRLSQTRVLLQGEMERASTATRVERELTELTRDYEINKELYEDLVKRRENLRLTMTLGQEKKDVLYRIEEAPNVPILPSGLRFAHIATAGLLLGMIMPFALLFLFLKLDPRIRTASAVVEDLDLPLLAVVPHMAMPGESGGVMSKSKTAILVVVAVLVIYALVGWIKFSQGVQ